MKFCLPARRRPIVERRHRAGKGRQLSKDPRWLRGLRKIVNSTSPQPPCVAFRVKGETFTGIHCRHRLYAICFCWIDLGTALLSLHTSPAKATYFQPSETLTQHFLCCAFRWTENVYWTLPVIFVVAAKLFQVLSGETNCVSSADCNKWQKKFLPGSKTTRAHTHAHTHTNKHTE